MLLIKNGYMIDPETGIEGKRDILIDEGKIRLFRNAFPFR